MFREGRVQRAFNIRSNAKHLRQSNSHLFQEVKRQREANEKLILEERERELRSKAQKRNKVRMIEIEAKENVERYWRGRLEGFREEREREVV